MKILLVEDDDIQSEWMGEELKKEFPKATVEVIPTELGFIERMEQLAANRPDVVIMDMMLRWTDPSPEMKPPPEEVKREGFYAAGRRCAQRLRDRKIDIPVILYTILDREEVNEGAEGVFAGVLAKGADLAPLFAAIRQAVIRLTKPSSDS